MDRGSCLSDFLAFLPHHHRVRHVPRLGTEVWKQRAEREDES